MPPGLKTRRKDRGADAIRKFAEQNAKSKGNVVAVGVLESAGRHKNAKLSVAEVATFHEFGTENLPERSFLRSTSKEHNAEIKKTIRQLREQVTRGKISVPSALAILGEKIKSLVQNKIRSGIEPPLKPATIAAKGSSKALIDTGQLLASIAYKVRQK